MTDQIKADMAQTELKIAASGEVEITAANKDEAKLPTFSFHGYTGEPMNLNGFYHPVIVDLEGVSFAEPVTALMNHDNDRIVGQGQGRVDASGIYATGTVMAEDDNASRVTTLSKNGFKWQGSIGADINRREFLEKDKKTVVNGREITGPMIIARDTHVHEISFVRRGADSKTSAAVAASHSSGKVTAMDPKFAEWLEAAGFTHHESLTEQQLKPLRAQWQTETAPQRGSTPPSLGDLFAKRRTQSDRVARITELTQHFLASNPYMNDTEVAHVEAMADNAVRQDWDAEKYELELLRASHPQTPVFRPSVLSGPKLTNRVIEAAICQAGRLQNVEKLYDDQTLQAAHDEFPHGISLGQIFLLCAEANGYHGRHSSTVTPEAHNFAFGLNGRNRIQASGFSALNISNILANTANKFLMTGWNAIDMTPLRISKVRPVRDFKQITTVSLTGDLQYDKLGVTGEIKHGTLADLTYNNQADTYARMLSISRKDMINDDLGALTAVPERLGRGAALKLNDIFWTEWLVLVNDSFFASGNSNINTGVADMTLGGLAATETIFMNQTDPDGKPLGIMPAIVVVPTALKASATALMSPGQNLLVTGASATIPNVNVYAGRFRVESSPYISNNSYTGATSTGWWMIADPNDLPLIEIAALNGRVEPTVESADADFNVLGVQMRGYTDVGVKRQEKRAGVYADGNAS